MKIRDPMKPVGVWDVRRRINISTLVHAEEAIAVERTIGALPGVCKVSADVEKQRITLRYDASQIDYQAILDALENTGFPPINSWWSQIKCGWFQFVDTNARANAKAAPAACCNKPPTAACCNKPQNRT